MLTGSKYENMEQQSNEIFRDQIDAQIKRIQILQEDG